VEFDNIFGRKYGGQIEEYRTEDADVVIMTMGSCTGTAKGVVDRKRETGMKVGLIKIRMLRPFPTERLTKVLEGKKAVGVIDRNVFYAGSCGHVFYELKALAGDLKAPAPHVLNFVAGLGGSDITPDHMERVIEMTCSAGAGKAFKPVTWLALE
jgi:pyruvate/2-oxoacid:ferredoxin oxidoreductase alpha subunit